MDHSLALLGVFYLFILLLIWLSSSSPIPMVLITFIFHLFAVSTLSGSECASEETRFDSAHTIAAPGLHQVERTAPLPIPRYCHRWHREQYEVLSMPLLHCSIRTWGVRYTILSFSQWLHYAENKIMKIIICPWHFFPVVDKDEEMAEFAKSVLQKTLNVKYPDFFAIHFSECILVMNGCTGKNWDCCWYWCWWYLLSEVTWSVLSIYWIDHPVFTAVASSGADGDSCAVNMDVRTYSCTCSYILFPMSIYVNLNHCLSTPASLRCFFTFVILDYHLPPFIYYY